MPCALAGLHKHPTVTRAGLLSSRVTFLAAPLSRSRFVVYWLVKTWRSPYGRCLPASLDPVVPAGQAARTGRRSGCRTPGKGRGSPELAFAEHDIVDEEGVAFDGKRGSCASQADVRGAWIIRWACVLLSMWRPKWVHKIPRRCLVSKSWRSFLEGGAR